MVPFSIIVWHKDGRHGAVGFRDDPELGTAGVAVGREETASLLEGSLVRHELRGNRAGASLRVKMSTNETDLVDFPLQGTYTRTLWKNAEEVDSAGREHIILSGEGIVVGLTREIPKRSNPGVQRPPGGGRR